MIRQLGTIMLLESWVYVFQRTSRTHNILVLFRFFSFSLGDHSGLASQTLSSLHTYPPPLLLPPPTAQSNTGCFWSVDFLGKYFTAPPHHPTPKSVYWCIRVPAFIWGYGPSILVHELFIVIYCIRECFSLGMWGLKGMVMCWTD